MKRPIFTALAPNLEQDDVWLAIKLLCKPWTWQKPEARITLEEAFRSFHKQPHLFAFASGRTCLYAILMQLHLAPEDEVLLQAYTCVAVPNPVLWVCAKPIYVDCDPETLTLSLQDLERKITSKSKVLIIQHTLGQPAALEPLLRLAKKHHLFVIEDCAHALGAQYQGELVGTFGEAAFFSFGRDKVISSVFGGMLTVKDETLAHAIQKYQQTLPLPSRGWVRQQLFHAPFTCVAKYLHPFGVGKVLLSLGKRLRWISPPVEPLEREGKAPSFLSYALSPALATLALHQFKKIGRFHTHRQGLAAYYTEKLEGKGFQLPVEVPETISAWLRYPIRTLQAKTLLAAAKAEHIYLGDWYATPIAPIGVNYQAVGYTTCVNAEQVAQETLNLPTDIHISHRDADRIISLLVSSL